MKNQSGLKTLQLCMAVLLMLAAVSFIPSSTIYGWKFKKVDLLASVRASDEANAIDSLSAIGVFEDSIQERIDSVSEQAQRVCPPGVTCIEDYSGDSTALHAFLNALSSIDKRNKPLRIAFYGDSFIEGDIFCGSVRDTLQTIFGGRGVGFVPITTHVAGFRNTVKQEYQNWKTMSIIGKKDSLFQRELGPAGYTFFPLLNNSVLYKASKQRYLREFPSMRLYYSCWGEANVILTINDTVPDFYTLNRHRSLQELKIPLEKATKIEFEVTPPDSVVLYGASFESGSGVIVDNFSMRGNSGVALYDISDRLMKDFQKFREYKLIILQYGLNVIREDSSRYQWYANKMIKVIENMKEMFPKASFLLVSVSDRSTLSEGEFKTMKGIPALRNTQRYVAQQTRIAFWDLYEAMGGANSMVAYVEAKPPLAAKDYTHLTFKGGKKLGSKLVKSLLVELERYESTRNLQ